MKVLFKHWFLIFLVLLGGYTLAPFLAPVFMRLGWDRAANAIYFIYSFFCHQMPQRSYFLFGQKLTYSLPEIQTAWQVTNQPWILRQFSGNGEMGWKVAWSDRMVAMYGSLLFFSLIWWTLRRRLPWLSWWGLALCLSPMALDGTSHFISDLAGIGQGFRDTNAWLASITGSVLPGTFYAGDAWGSFNSLMRLSTGVLFGLGVAWFVLPRLRMSFTEEEI